MKLWLESDEFSARWADVTEEQMDAITSYIEALIGKPDTVTG